MREILFRGQRVDSKEWIEGCYVKSVAKNSPFAYIITSHPSEPIRVYAKTVGEYIGTTDKYTIRIFEDDIVEYQGELGKITYHKEEAMFVVEFDTWLTDFDHIYDKELEVVGNIHDNPNMWRN